MMAEAEAEATEKATPSYLIVVAFDFGTTYSGYAFSFRNDPLKVITNHSWVAGSETLMSLKTPTCVLLNPHHQFHSFGFDAENKYAGLAFEEEHSGWLFFRHFKMLLHKKKLTRDMVIDDINGAQMPALTIFAMAIRFLRERFLDELDKQVTGVKETDIQYVLTVPAIWDDSARQFMREAAILAGFDTTRLKLALEPESASIWCQAITDESEKSLKKSGTQYMVIDLGGGTTDVSVHRKNSDGTLNELHKASGGPWGGTNVDNNYIKWLEKFYGRKAVDRFKAEEMSDFIDLLRDFETKKRSIKFDTMDPVVIKIPAILRELSEKEEGETLSERIISLHLGTDVAIRRDKMKINPSIAKQWFDEPLDKTICHVKGILSESNMDEIESILLVGGFAESKYVQEKLKYAVPDKRFIVPNEAGMTVLKGAVRFGHDPNLVSTRIMKFSYGISTTRDYDAARDRIALTKLIKGKRKVENVFQKYVSAGEAVTVGHRVGKQLVPVCMEKAVLSIFRSEDPNPMFTTDHGCVKLGELTVNHPEGETRQDKKTEIFLTFGDTEVEVNVRIIKTGKEYRTTINCL